MRTITGIGYVRTGLLLVLVAAAIVPARAALARSLRLEELVSHSTNVVVGHCTSAEARWNDDHTQIVTVARYDVADDLKGDLRGSVDVVTLGGEVGDVGMYVSGMPTFSAGDDSVLFLTAGDAGYEVVGMSQGKFKVAFATPSSSPVVVRPLGGLELVGDDDERLDVGSLSTFVRTVRAAAH